MDSNLIAMIIYSIVVIKCVICFDAIVTINDYVDI